MPITQRDLHQQLGATMRANHARVAELARPLDPERLVRKPAPDAWSVGETVEHLLLMDALFIPVVLERVRASRADAAAPLREWRPSLIGRMIVGSLEKPKPLLAPKAGRPGTPRAGVVERFLTEDARYLAAMDDAASLDWSAIRFAPPVAPWMPLRINLGDAFRIHAVHVTRHIGQIERTIARTIAAA
jgi:hypothetical protein